MATGRGSATRRRLDGDAGTSAAPATASGTSSRPTGGVPIGPTGMGRTTSLVGPPGRLTKAVPVARLVSCRPRPAMSRTCRSTAARTTASRSYASVASVSTGASPANVRSRGPATEVCLAANGPPPSADPTIAATATATAAPTRRRSPRHAARLAGRGASPITVSGT